MDAQHKRHDAAEHRSVVSVLRAGLCGRMRWVHGAQRNAPPGRAVLENFVRNTSSAGSTGPRYGPSRWPCERKDGHKPTKIHSRKKKDRTPEGIRSLGVSDDAAGANRGAAAPRMIDAPSGRGSTLLRGHLGRGRSLLHAGGLHGGLNITATAASTTTAAAAIATAIATAVATAVAAGMATAVAPIPMMATAVAAAAVAAVAAATAAAKDEGRSLLLTAHQGDSNQGEKHRQSKHNNSVHPRILQL